ncbi:MAG: O-antigen ligase family protein [Chloroflexi bacterium]|nr:O-antigen ligase family protein [Chloroflexota bacterium]
MKILFPLWRIQWICVGALAVLAPLAMDVSLPSRIFSIPKLITMHTLSALGLGALLLQRDGSVFQKALSRPNFPRYLFGCIALWVGWLALTTLTAQDPARSWWGSYQWSLGLFTQLGFLALAWLTFLTVTTAPDSQRFYRLAIGASLPIVVYALIQYLQLDWITWGARDAGRVFSTLGNQNYLGGYLTIIALLTLCECLESKTWLSRLLWGALLLVQIFCLWVTECKGAMLAVAISAVVLLWLRWNFHWQTAIGLVGFLIAGSLTASLLLGARGEEWGTLYARFNPWEGRLFTWATAYSAVAARPWVGWGLSSFDLVLPAHSTPGFIYQQFTYEHSGLTLDRAHNMWWELAVETGVVGVALWMLWIGALLYTVMRSAHRQPLLRGRLIAAAMALIGYLLHQLFNPSDVGSATIFWWLAAWTLATAFLPSQATPESVVAPIAKVEDGRFLSQIFFLITTFGSGYALWQWLQRV